MKGSIRFNNAVNAEVDTDGSEITSVVNLVDGQSLSNNWVETIEGTLDAPFGDYTRAEIDALLRDGSITLKCVADGTVLSMGTINIPFFDVTPLGEHVTASIYAELLDGNTGDWAMLDWYSYDNSADAQYFKVYQSGTETVLTTYMSSIPTVLTIYHHPMPA